MRPKEVPLAPAPVPSETELEQLARRAERRSLEDMNQFFADVARDVAPSIAYIHSTEASGIAWDASRVVTAFRPRGWSAGPVRLAMSKEVQAEPTTWGPNLPLSVLTITPGAAAAAPVHRSQLMPSTGDWVVAVWRTGTAPAHSVGNFRQALPITCGAVPVQELTSSLALTGTMVGGGLFDLDGGLLAVILACEDRWVAVSAPSIASLLERPMSPEQQLEARYGLIAGPMAADEQAYFSAPAGLLVRTVWIDHPADAAGIRPGDVIVAVSGQAVATAQDLAAQMSKDALEVTVQRGRIRLAITLTSSDDAPASVQSTGPGLALETPSPRTYRIGSVQANSRAATAGVEPGDRLVSVDRAEPRAIAQVERTLDNGGRPVWLELIRGRRRLGVLLRSSDGR